MQDIAHIKFRRLGFYAVLILQLAIVASGHAQPASTNNKSQPVVQKRSPLSIPCPAVIADQRDGTYFSKLSPKGSYPFLCFPSVSNASKKGFRNLNKATAFNYSGWYRIKLSLEKDSCSSDAVIGTGPVLFLQIKENDSGVFGEFCPSIGSYGGIRTGAGFTISGIDEFSEQADESLCDDGKVKKQQFVEMTKIADGVKAFTVTYKEIKTCTSSSSGAASCSREYSGTATYETHPIWPKVSDNLTEIPSGCTQALTTCGNCHPELQNN